jgi:phage terminase large subunit GpA-like protein
LCEACGALFQHDDYVRVWDQGVWVSDDGTWIDPEGYFRAESGDVVSAPEHVAFHIWTAYSLTGWRKIVTEFLSAVRSGDQGKLKTFVNTTLGEAWEEDAGEKTDAQALMMRREHYVAPAPRGVVAVVASVDTQDDRFEIQYDGYGVGEERWTLAYTRLFGDPSRPEIWNKLAEALRRNFKREDGTLLHVVVATQDHGGHYSDEVNTFSKRMGIRFLIPIKGSSQTGRPVVVMPRKKNAKGVYLSEVGTDTAKSLLYQRYLITDPGPGYVHWPVSDEFDRTYFDQVTAEKRKKKYVKGRPVVAWDAGGRRNEATDVSVYSLAAIRIAQQNLGLDLSVPPPASDAPAPAASKRTLVRRTVKSRYVGR